MNESGTVAHGLTVSSEPTSHVRDDSRPSILALSEDELIGALAERGQPRFRAGQIRRWIYREHVDTFDAMTDLPRRLRDELAASFRVLPVEPVTESVSDGDLTRKALLKLSDGEAIEAVLMSYPARRSGERSRHTVCVSTQAGCAVGCPFCATGLSGFRRQLEPAEIVAQVVHFGRRLRSEKPGDEQVTNVVFMGQGEPLANPERVWRAVETINSPDHLGLGARHVTISTSGIAPRIRELAERPLQVGLAVSLHAPNDELRDRLVPLNRRYPIAEVMDACRHYVARTNRRVSFEYTMMSGVNDSPMLAESLADLLSGFLCHVNLIPLNRVDGAPFQPSSAVRMREFQEVLRNRGIQCTLRETRGESIDAACGQLRARQLG